MKKLYLSIKGLYISCKKFLKENLPSIVKGTTMFLLIILLAILVIPIVNDLISKYIEPYSVRLLDLDKKIFVVIDCTIIILAFLILAITIYKFRDRKFWHFPSLPFYIFLFVSIIWGYESFISNEWVQLGIFNTGLTYSSLIIFLLFTVLIVYFVFWSKFVWAQIRRRRDKEVRALERISQRKDYVYTDDEPIVRAEEDILGRKTFARNIAKWIYDLDVQKGACSIAINSPWGYGKTSFLNLIKEQVAMNDDFIIMEFSPWHFSPSSDITKMFFSRLENDFKDINNQLSDFFAEYADLLSDTEYSFIQKLLRGKKDYKTLMTDISNLLKVLGRKLIIIIDDFDRLSSTAYIAA